MGTGTTIRAIDLRAPVYRDVSRLRSRLDKYIEALVDFEGVAFAGVEMISAMVQGRRLHIVVPVPSMTEEQRVTLAAARDRSRSLGIDFVVTDI